MYLLIQTKTKKIFSELATISADGTAFPLDLISKGTTFVCEHNWFGKCRNINNKDKNYELELLPNSKFQNSSSRESSDEFIKPKSVADHSPSRWINFPSWLHYLYTLRYNQNQIKYSIFFGHFYIIRACTL